MSTIENVFTYMVPEKYFVYYSFTSKSNWQIVSLDETTVLLRNFDTNKVVKEKLADFFKAIQDKQLKENKRQNEMFKVLNKINK
jgi:hypothetical protein